MRTSFYCTPSYFKEFVTIMEAAGVNVVYNPAAGGSGEVTLVGSLENLRQARLWVSARRATRF